MIKVKIPLEPPRDLYLDEDVDLDVDLDEEVDEYNPE